MFCIIYLHYSIEIYFIQIINQNRIRASGLMVETSYAGIDTDLDLEKVTNQYDYET